MSSLFSPFFGFYLATSQMKRNNLSAQKQGRTAARNDALIHGGLTLTMIVMEDDDEAEADDGDYGNFDGHEGW